MRTKINYILICVISLLFVGCKATQLPRSESSSLSSKVILTIPLESRIISLHGSLKMVEGDKIQLSILIPFIKRELGRLELTPQHLLVIDRMNKRYMKASIPQVSSLLSDKYTYRQVEKILVNVSKSGSIELSGAEFGIPQLAKARVKLYAFTTSPLTLYSSQIPSHYHEIKLDDLLAYLRTL